MKIRKNGTVLVVTTGTVLDNVARQKLAAVKKVLPANPLQVLSGAMEVYSMTLLLLGLTATKTVSVFGVDGAVHLPTAEVNRIIYNTVHALPNNRQSCSVIVMDAQIARAIVGVRKILPWSVYVHAWKRAGEEHNHPLVEGGRLLNPLTPEVIALSR